MDGHVGSVDGHMGSVRGHVGGVSMCGQVLKCLRWSHVACKGWYCEGNDMRA